MVSRERGPFFFKDVAAGAHRAPVDGPMFIDIWAALIELGY